MYALPTHKNSKLLITFDLVVVVAVPMLLSLYFGGEATYKYIYAAVIFIPTNLLSLLLVLINEGYRKSNDFTVGNVIATISRSIIVGNGIVLCFVYLFISHAYQDIFVTFRSLFVPNALAMMTGIAVTRKYYMKRIRNKLCYRALVIGGGEGKMEGFLYQFLRQNKVNSLTISGRVSGSQAHDFTEKAKTLGGYDDFDQIVEKNGVNLVIVAVDELDDKLFQKITGSKAIREKNINVTDLFEMLYGSLPFEYLNYSQFYSYICNMPRRYLDWVKPASDFVLSCVGLVVTFPLLLCGMLLVRLSSRGPILYSQIRTGCNGNEFKILKLRTMKVDAEKNGIMQTLKNDDRIVRFGKFLRRFRIDEIPQFINVIRGEMSLIGPRPERPEFISQYEKELPFYRFRLMVRPGITGWAQIETDYANCFEGTKEKLFRDLYYLKNVSFTLDLNIALRTLRIILLGKGR